MGHNSFVYLDDGFCSQPERTSAVAAAFIQRKDLVSCGLLVNEEKSHWVPMQAGEWPGFVINTISMTFRLIKLLPQSSSAFPLVRRIVKARCKEYFHSSLGVSVSTLREEFKKNIEPFVSDISKYGTHSIKSGAASNPACRRIAGDLLAIHAGWRCESTKHRYIMVLASV